MSETDQQNSPELDSLPQDIRFKVEIVPLTIGDRDQEDNLIFDESQARNHYLIRLFVEEQEKPVFVKKCLVYLDGNPITNGVDSAFQSYARQGEFDQVEKSIDFRQVLSCYSREKYQEGLREKQLTYRFLNRTNDSLNDLTSFVLTTDKSDLVKSKALAS